MQAINPVNATALYTYTGTELHQVQDPAGNVTGYGYDIAGRPLSTTDPTGATTRYAYDNVGNTTTITRPLDYAHPLTVSVETRHYDALDEPITDTVAGSGEMTPTAPITTITTYDLDGNVVERVAPNGDVTYNTTDNADRLKQAQVYAAGAPINGSGIAGAAYLLDQANNPKDTFDYQQYDHTGTFDAASRLSQRLECPQACLLPRSTPITTTLSYDPDGNVRSLARYDSTAGGAQAERTL